MFEMDLDIYTATRDREGGPLCLTNFFADADADDRTECDDELSLGEIIGHALSYFAILLFALWLIFVI